MSVLDGPGEGTWSVFAQRVVRERDDAREEIERCHDSLRNADATIQAAYRELLRCWARGASREEIVSLLPKDEVSHEN